MTESRQKPGRSKQDYETPADLLAAVTERFGPLEVDLAARADNAKAPLFVTPEEDSLTIQWASRFEGKRCWLNPPFGDIAPWVAKAKAATVDASLLCELGMQILVLTPASIGADWFREHVNGKALVLGLSPRLTFVGAKDPYPKDCMLSVFGVEPGFDVWRWK